MLQCKRIRRFLLALKGINKTYLLYQLILFLDVRSNDESVTYTVVDQIMGFLRPITSVVDETHGFHYEQGRAIIDFVDGTENLLAKKL